MNLWVDPSFCDCLATALASQVVMMRPLDPSLPVSGSNPKIPKIEPDYLLMGAARYIFCRDLVDRLDAYSTIDFSGAQLRAAGIRTESTVGNEAGLVHEAYECLRAAGSYDLDKNLTAMIAGRQTITVDGRDQFVSLPDVWVGVDLYTAAAVAPRGVHGAILPLMARTPSGKYSPGKAQHGAGLLNELRAVRQAAGELLDAGLAASAAATWAAARADLLAQAQVLHPERGYT